MPVVPEDLNVDATQLVARLSAACAQQTQQIVVMQLQIEHLTEMIAERDAQLSTPNRAALRRLAKEGATPPQP